MRLSLSKKDVVKVEKIINSCSAINQHLINSLEYLQNA